MSDDTVSKEGVLSAVRIALKGHEFQDRFNAALGAYEHHRHVHSCHCGWVDTLTGSAESRAQPPTAPVATTAKPDTAQAASAVPPLVPSDPRPLPPSRTHKMGRTTSQRAAVPTSAGVVSGSRVAFEQQNRTEPKSDSDVD